MILKTNPFQGDVAPPHGAAASVEASAKTEFDGWGGKMQLKACLAAMD